MNPLPVAVYPAVAVAEELGAVPRIAMGLSVALGRSIAGVWAGPPQSAFVVSPVGRKESMYCGNGPTQNKSAQVSKSFFPSRVSAGSTAANDSSVSTPHVGPIVVLNGTRT